MGRPPKEKTEDMLAEAQTIKEPTKPGWRPANKLSYLKARAGYTARWVDSKQENVMKKKAEGWVVMKPSDHVGIPLETLDVNDGNAIGNEIRQREMIAMMIPDSLKAERADYYRSENKRAMDSILRESNEGLKKMGAATFKPKGMSGRIVID